MNKRLWAVLSVVVALLAVVPHLPSWLPAARTALSGISGASLLDGSSNAWLTLRQWTGAHPRQLEITASILAGIVIVLTAVRYRRRPRWTIGTGLGLERERSRAESDIWVMPRAVPVERSTADGEWLITDPPAGVAPQTPPPGTVEISTEGQPVLLTATEADVGPSRRALVHDLFERGLSIHEIARLTGIGQDAIRATVRELRSA